MQIIENYLKISPYYKSGIILGIPDSDLRILLGYTPFLRILCKLNDHKIEYKFDINAFSVKHSDEIESCENYSHRTYLQKIINIMSSQLENYNYNNKIKNKIKFKIDLEHYLKQFENLPTLSNFVNVAIHYYYLFEVENLISFLKSNIDMTLRLLEWKNFHFIFAIVFRPYNYMLKNNDLKERELELFNLLDTKFYNPIMKYDSYNGTYKFLLHRIEEDEECKKLKDEDGRVICIVCLEDLNGKAIYCISCKKYIGHMECIKKSATIYKKCPYCNVGF
jgi:hypothetical protein